MTSQERQARSKQRRSYAAGVRDADTNAADAAESDLHAPVRQGRSDRSATGALELMLSHLDIRPGMRILEVTDGIAPVPPARWERAGVASVDSVSLGAPELPPARSGAGRYGTDRYDRVLVSAPVRLVSPDWLTATRTGGVVAVPWANPLAGPTLVRLVVDDERAAGPFVSLLSDLPRRAPDGPAFLDLHAATLASGSEFTCGLDAGEIWSDPHALFAMGIRIPDVRYAEAEVPDSGGRTGRWVYDGESWAGVTVSATGGDPRWEHYGFSRLGSALDGAYRWWLDNDKPGPDRFGMTVASFGQFGWLGDRYSGRIWRL